MCDLNGIVQLGEEPLLEDFPSLPLGKCIGQSRPHMRKAYKFVIPKIAFHLSSISFRC
jgi:hypothetical protein